MNKKGHRIGGTVLLGVSLAIVQPNIKQGIIMATGIYLGSFLPDLDAEKSYIRYKLKLITMLYDLLPKNILFRHRGLFLHSIWTLIWLICTYTYFKLEWILWMILGVIGHHILDSLTPAKLPKYFYPFTKFK